MSEALYITRLWWDGHRRTGTAAHNGQREILRSVPLDLAHAISIDYAPVVDVLQLQEAAGPMRSMTPAEAAAAAAYLAALFPPAAGQP